jgi:hypothetical protein
MKADSKSIAHSVARVEIEQALSQHLEDKHGGKSLLRR